MKENRTDNDERSDEREDPTEAQALFPYPPPQWIMTVLIPLAQYANLTLTRVNGVSVSHAIM